MDTSSEVETTHGASPGPTEALAAFAAGSRVASDRSTGRLSQVLADTVAVAVAGTGRQGEALLRAWASAESRGGRSTVWVGGGRTSAATAALLNGNAGHLLDYDDISPSMPMHPSVVLLPALIAVAEERDVDARRLLDAYDVGAAAFRAVAELLPQDIHYQRGWHTTSTVGRLAAVAALVRLVGTDVSVARHALGIVSSFVAGGRSNFGTMAKPLHAGAAARDAVMALALAESGFTAHPCELEAQGGFFERLGEPRAAPSGDVGDTLGERLGHWLERWPLDWGIKRYPACYGTHRAVDAAIALHERLDGAVPNRVRVHVHRTATDPLLPYPPADATQAKFSAEYVVAVALRTGRLGLRDFTADAFEDAAVRELADRVSVVEAASPPTGPAAADGCFAVVDVTLDSGETESERVDVTRGDGRNPLSRTEIRAKVVDCCVSAGFTPEQADRFCDALWELPGQRSFEDLTDALRRADTDGEESR